MERTRVADRVRAVRGLRFVGRHTERELFRQAVEAQGEPPFTVLHVHGPGGIGKSALLRVFGDLAAAAGADVVRVDGRDVALDRDALRALVAPAVTATRRTVLLVDGYDLLAPLDGWLRDELLAELPADGVVVLAGRAAPAPGWTEDPGWRPLCRSLPLAPLTDREAAECLAGSRLDERERGRVVAFASGYPLVLLLAADLAGSDDVTGRLTAPEAVGRLATRLVDSAPTARHQRALELCARARVTTERLLRDVLRDEAAGELFDWLGGQPCVEPGPHGLRAHDVVRDVLLRDLAWRDPDTAGALSLAYYVDVLGRIRGGSGPVREEALLDAVYDTRHSPRIRDYYDWTTFGAVTGEPYRSADRDGVREILERHLTPADAAAVLRWCDLQPDGADVYHRDGVVGGVVLRLQLHEATPEQVAADPVTAAVRATAERLGIGADETVTVDRCALDRDAGCRPSPAFNIACENGLRTSLTRPDLALDALVTADPGYGSRYFEIIGYGLVRTLVVDGGRIAVHAHDWREKAPDGWWECIPPRGHRAAEPDAAFVDAVRLALRDLSRPERLARSPLVAAGVAGSGADLRAELLGAVDTLRGHPRDVKLHRALDRTYVRPAPTQERAAEVLGLPFSTYRRHLTGGITRVASALWSGGN